MNLANDIGVMVQLSPAHRLVGFYELKYTGPGLRREEGEKFTDRAMDHILILRHHYALSPVYTLKSQIDYMTEYKRTGSNEVWGTGLYDFARCGGAAYLSRKFSPVLSAEVSLQMHVLDFPNYTDILAEFQAAGESTESSTGKQNQAVYQVGGSLTYGRSKLTLDYSLTNYHKQKVIVETVQADGTYYSGTLQQDRSFSVDMQYDMSFWQQLAVSPQVRFKTKVSNQNYQHFTTASSTVPVQYIGNYYDYSQITLSLPISLHLTSRWEFLVTPEWEQKYYAHRPPRDAENLFTSGTQQNNLFMLTLGFAYKPNAVTKTTFFFISQQQSSNMLFEKYLPYNYIGNFFGINFHYTY
jgi:hypothetical protein